MAAGTNDFALGTATGGFGYYGITAGTAASNEIDVGGYSGGGSGLLEVKGGVLNDAGWIVLSRNATLAQTGVLNVSGGLVHYAGSGLVANWGAGQTSIINVTGGTLAATAAEPINLNESGNATNTGILNLDGGLVQASLVNGASGQVNFNGGTLMAYSATNNFLSGLASTFVYTSGGTINNNGVAITIGQPLLAPSGSGATAAGANDRRRQRVRISPHRHA